MVWYKKMSTYALILKRKGPLLCNRQCILCDGVLHNIFSHIYKSWLAHIYCLQVHILTCQQRHYYALCHSNNHTFNIWYNDLISQYFFLNIFLIISMPFLVCVFILWCYFQSSITLRLFFLLLSNKFPMCSISLINIITLSL